MPGIIVVLGNGEVKICYQPKDKGSNNNKFIITNLGALLQKAHEAQEVNDNNNQTHYSDSETDCTRLGEC